MSGTIEVPKGLDKLTAEETKLFDQMRADDTGPEPEPAREPAPRPAPIAEPDPAPVAEVAEDEDDGVAPEARSKTVPHQQFHAERERRKAAEAKLRETETAAATAKAALQERVNLMVAAAQASAAVPVAAPVAEEIPDIATDPVAHFQAMTRRQQAEIDSLKGILSGSQEQAQQMNQVRALQDWGAGQERAYAAKEPTYGEAMEFLRQSRRTELAAIGVADPAEQERIIGMDVHAIAARSRQEGGDFADRLYKLAQARGYEKATPAAAAAPADGASIAIPPLAAPSAAARAQAGRDNAVTIGSGGAAPPARLSVDKIANMSEGQFSALLARMQGDPQALRDLMGN